MIRMSFEQKRLEMTIHIISWMLIFLFPAMLTEWGTGVSHTQNLRHFVLPLCSCIVFYINYLVLVPKYFFRNCIGRFLVLNILLITCMEWGLHYMPVLFPAPPPAILPDAMPVPPLPFRWFMAGRHWVMLAFVIGLSTAIRVSFRWRQTEKRLVQAEREKTEAELKNLKIQLNPHFLLNTLNNIYALIALDGTRAQEAVQELGKMLRYVLYDNQSLKVALTKELDFIDNYISLMRIRLPKSVEVSVKLDAGKRTLQISPLIFISLIENAFKHGVSPTEPSFISISICGHTDGRITCETMNSNFPKTKADKSGSGIGLVQVQRRLELAYPDNYEWVKGANEDGRIYTSLLTIQTSES